MLMCILGAIKKRNQMMLYARCVAIRDKQLIEKGGIKDQHRVEEERLDAIMEKERVRGILQAQEREKRRGSCNFLR